MGVFQPRTVEPLVGRMGHGCLPRPEVGRRHPSLGEEGHVGPSELGPHRQVVTSDHRGQHRVRQSGRGGRDARRPWWRSSWRWRTAPRRSHRCQFASYRTLRYRFGNVDHVTAFAALHPHRTTGNFLVVDLVLRLATGAEKFHVGENVPGRAAPNWPARVRIARNLPHSRLRRCFLMVIFVSSSAARPKARSQVSAALLRNPAFW